MIRDRKCGCDCRDTETFTQAPPISHTSPCCHLCPDFQAPCLWIARFGCVVRPDTVDVLTADPERGLACADVYLRPDCYFGDRPIFRFGELDIGGVNSPGGNCVWSALGRGVPAGGVAAACAGTNERGIIDLDAHPCQWDDITGIVPRFFSNPITSFDLSWILRVGEISSTLSWDHPTLGLLEYTTTEAWDCAGPNTMLLTSGAETVPELPKSICVVPSDEESAGGCNLEVPCGYPTAEARCICGDKCCPCIPGFISVTCGGTGTGTGSGGTLTAGCSGNFCIGGRTGLSSPAGPSRELCCTINLPTANTGTGGGTSLQSRLVCMVVYCDGAGWLADLYVDGEFCGTEPIVISSFCPLTGTVTFPPGCIECTVEVCIGAGCEPPPPPPVDLECCPDTTWPAALDGLLTSSMADVNGQTITLIYEAGPPVGYRGTFVRACGDTIEVFVTVCSSGASPPTGTASWRVYNLATDPNDCASANSMSSFDIICDPPGFDTFDYSIVSSGMGACTCAAYGGETIAISAV